MRTHTRRDVLTLAAAGGFAAAVPLARRVSASSIIDELTAGLPEPEPTSPFVPPFSMQMRVPPILRPVRSVGTTDFYEIVQRPVLAQILPGAKTPVWGYNGMVPGPTLPLPLGRTAMVKQTNHLPVHVTTHLHGGRVRPEDDGHPTAFVEPGESFTYEYPSHLHYAPLWYHDHTDHATGRNVWMGLAGNVLISDPADAALLLPKGAFNVPLMIFDRLFNRDNTLLYPHDPGGGPAQVVQKGALGDVILVNGTPQPRFPVKRRKYMFRILNASNARQYLLSLDHDIPMTVVASDGGYLPTPVKVFQLPVGNAERYDVVVDFTAVPSGTRVIMKNLAGEGRTSQVMRFDVGATVADPSRIPTTLRTIDVNPADAVQTREFRFDRRHGAWSINGLQFDEHRIDAFPRLGTTEIWKLVNNSGGWTHPVHIHLVHFAIVDRNGAPPKPWETGPKDTVMVGPNETVRLAVLIEGFRGVYVFHCHNIEHEDHDMMSQFQVV